MDRRRFIAGLTAPGLVKPPNRLHGLVDLVHGKADTCMAQINLLDCVGDTTPYEAVKCELVSFAHREVAETCSMIVNRVDKSFTVEFEMCDPPAAVPSFAKTVPGLKHGETLDFDWPVKADEGSGAKLPAHDPGSSTRPGGQSSNSRLA